MTEQTERDITIDIIGHKIVEIRPMTTEEIERENWYPGTCAVAIVLDNGVVLYPSSDYEGNDAGALFGAYPTGETFTIVE